VIQSTLGGLDLILRSLLLHLLPLNHFHPRIFSWFSLPIQQLAQFPGSCRSHMSYIGKLQSVSFNTYRAPSPLGFIMQYTLHYISSGLLISTGLVIALIAIPHLITQSVLVPGLYVGRARSKFPFLYLQSSQSTKG
jgi:hypothetical protein